MKQKIFADKLIKGIDSARNKAKKDKRSTAAYWNADDWGSMSGHKDADNWTKDQVTKWVIKFIAKNKESIGD